MKYSCRLRLPGLLLAATILLALGASTASAAGTITGTVFVDRNSNGVQNTGGYSSGKEFSLDEPGAEGVAITAYDSRNKAVGSATSGASGAYSLSVSTDETVRLQFSTPTGYEPSFAGAGNGTSVHFAKAGATGVDYAILRTDEYCESNPLMVTCKQPAVDQMTERPTSRGAISFPAAFPKAQGYLADGSIDGTNDLSGGATTEALMKDLGSVFGVGVDRGGNAYFGTYVKRHAPYGPAGAVNAIYRVTLGGTGTPSTFVTLGSETLPAHSAWIPAGQESNYPPYSRDGHFQDTPSDPGYSEVYGKVGRAGIGDVDVTPDGKMLLAVEMTESAPKLWSVPINGTGAAATAGTPTSEAIPAPTTFAGVSCIGTWHPMGIGVRGSRVLVGGVCGGDETRFLNANDTATEAAAFVLERSGGSFTTIAATSLGYKKGTSMNGQNFGDPMVSGTGMWHNWFDGNLGTRTNGQLNPWFIGRHMPMLANIEIMDNGDLVLGLRDRWHDQMKPAVTIDYWKTGVASSANTEAAAEILRMCFTGSGFTRENDGACGDLTGARLGGVLHSQPTYRPESPLFYAASYVYSGGATSVTHPYTGLGGTAAVAGSPIVWSTVYDVTSAGQQGVKAFGACPTRSADVGTCGPTGVKDGAQIGGLLIDDVAFGVDARYGYDKGNGLGDLEIACGGAPVQIGNRVWIDTNKDGIQDPNEPPVAGVTARLYDAGGSVVGTAVTDANGQYYFASNAMAGAAANTGGGLTAGAAFTVKFDNKADFAKGGPLYGYVSTKANVKKYGDAVNSKATKVGGHPTIMVPARTIGENNHTYDAGFYSTASGGDLVAVGNYTWVDTNKNGIQDEKPLKGVKVQLLTTKGKPAKNAAGKVVGIKTTDKKGYYVFDGLKAGKYKVRFVLPTGYRFTTVVKGKAKRNSNPIPTKRNPLVGETPVFEVFAKVKGNTVRNIDKKLKASFIDPTIDAGVVPVTPDQQGASPVTG